MLKHLTTAGNLMLAHGRQTKESSSVRSPTGDCKSIPRTTSNNRDESTISIPPVNPTPTGGGWHGRRTIAGGQAHTSTQHFQPGNRDMGPQILGQLLKDLEPLMSQAAEDFEHEITCCQMEPQKAISGIGHQRCSTAGDSSRSDSISVPRRPLPTTLRRPRTSSFLEARRLRTVSGHETCSRDVPCSDKAGDRNAIPSTKSGDLIEAEPLCWTGLDFKNQPFRLKHLLASAPYW